MSNEYFPLETTEKRAFTLYLDSNLTYLLIILLRYTFAIGNNSRNERKKTHILMVSLYHTAV